MAAEQKKAQGKSPRSDGGKKEVVKVEPEKPKEVPVESAKPSPAKSEVKVDAHAEAVKPDPLDEERQLKEIA